MRLLVSRVQSETSLSVDPMTPVAAPVPLTAFTSAQLVSNVQHEQAQAANGIGVNGKPVLTKVEDFGIKLAHQFPWAPAAAVAVGLALRRRFLSSPDAPSGVVRRLQVTKVQLSSSHLPFCMAQIRYY